MEDVFMPTLRKKLTGDPYGATDLANNESDELISANPGGVFSPNVPSAPADEAGHYEPNRSRSNAPYVPTLLREGETIPVGSAAPTSGAASQNPYLSRLNDLGGQLQSAYAAPHAGMLRQVLGALLSRRNPQLGGIVSGETQRERKIEPLQQEYGLLSSIASQDYARQKTMADITKSAAEGHKAEAEAGAVPAKVALEQAQTEAANYKDDPNLGLIDLRTKQPVNPAGFAPLTADEAKVLGKQEGDRVPLKVKNTANEMANRGITTVNTEEGVYERNRQQGTMKRLGANPRMMFAPEEKIIEVPDSEHPGQTKLIKAGQALKEGTPGIKSASFTVPRRVMEWATSGKGGEEINSFNTALQHADLLRDVAEALRNGDNRTLNTLSNRFKTEFGWSGEINFNAVAGAYSREITKMLSAGHLTDKEISESGATIPSNVNLETIDDVIDSYKALASSKMMMRYNQFKKGLEGKPNFPESITTPGAANAPPAGAKIRDYSTLKP